MRIKRFSIALVVLMVLAGFALVTAQTGVLFVKNNNVGIGIDDPLNLLHVQGAATDGLIFLLENTVSAPGFRFRNGSTGRTWFFRGNSFDTFNVSLEGTGGEEMRIRTDGTVIMGPGGFQAFLLNPAGNLTIAGTLTQGSSRTIKRDITPVDGRDVLSRVAQLPVSAWTYETDPDDTRHVGPMAEDFRAAFGLGVDEKHLAPGDVAGVALAAVQGLNETMLEKDRRISALEAELAELKAMIAKLPVVAEN